MGIYATVLFVLGMANRFSDLADASIDRVGLDLEEERLPQRVRARRATWRTRRKAVVAMERELLVYVDLAGKPVPAEPPLGSRARQQGECVLRIRRELARAA